MLFDVTYWWRRYTRYVDETKIAAGLTDGAQAGGHYLDLPRTRVLGVFTFRANTLPPRPPYPGQRPEVYGIGLPISARGLAGGQDRSAGCRSPYPQVVADERFHNVFFVLDHGNADHEQMLCAWSRLGRELVRPLRPRDPSHNTRQG